MEQFQSPLDAVKRLEASLNNHLASVDIYELSAAERTALQRLRREVADGRLDIRDYEMSETRQQQIDCATQAAKRLQRANKQILALSQTNLFGPADVAQLSSQIEQIITNLR